MYAKHHLIKANIWGILSWNFVYEGQVQAWKKCNNNQLILRMAFTFELTTFLMHATHRLTEANTWRVKLFWSPSNQGHDHTSRIVASIPLNASLTFELPTRFMVGSQRLKTNIGTKLFSNPFNYALVTAKMSKVWQNEGHRRNSRCTFHIHYIKYRV